MAARADMLGMYPPCAAKWAVPLARPSVWRPPALARALSTRTAVITAPPGYGPSESLAGAVAAERRGLLWIRLGPEDRDPAMTLVTLIAAAGRLGPGIGRVTIEGMRREPGPITGWPAHFARLGEELGQGLPKGTAIVIEQDQDPSPYKHVLGLVCAHLLPALPEGFSLILISPSGEPPVDLPKGTCQLSERDLRLNPNAADNLAQLLDLKLPRILMRRVLTLTDGRAVALVGLGLAGGMLGPATIERIAECAGDAADLFARLTQSWLALHDAPTRQALALTLRLGLGHPALTEASLGGGASTVDDPWLQPLSDGWLRMRGLWRRPLSAGLRTAAPDAAVLHRAADHLSKIGALERAVPLYLSLGESGCAAEVIAGAADCLVQTGRWDTVDDWLAQLPAEVLREQPRLLCVSGGIAVAGGYVDRARALFATAEALFTARCDYNEACECLLAESDVAARQGDFVHAAKYALTATRTATGASLASQRGRAFWQLAKLAVEAADWDHALANLSQARLAAESAGDSAFVEMMDRAEALVLDERALRHQIDIQGQALRATEQAERHAVHRLRQVIEGPAATCYIPMMASPRPDAGPPATGTVESAPSGSPRVPGEAPAYPSAGVREGSEGANLGWWQRVAARLRGSRPLAPPPRPISAQAAAPALPRLDPALWHLSAARPGETAERSGSPAGIAAAETVAWQPPAAFVATTAKVPAPAPPATAPFCIETKSLTVYLLGPFRVLLGGQVVSTWPSGRGRAVFMYLLAHRALPLPRDVLMDVFWPDAAPDSARNSLNVALHGLRQAFQLLDEIPVVLFENGAYRLNPELAVWVDADEFERQAEAGRGAEARGDVVAAMAIYEGACELYEGDFLAEDPYANWPTARRERLRQLNIECLDRLGALHFERGAYAACINACKCLLACDACHEDAHCRLMRCYARQGRYHLAVRQYQACTEALAREIEMEPGPATQALYVQVRQREGL